MPSSNLKTSLITCTATALLACYSQSLAEDAPPRDVLKIWPQYVGLNSWANQVPVEDSQEIVDIAFTGQHAEYTHADTWYPSWASDGNLYSPWTDGSIGDEECISWNNEKADRVRRKSSATTR